MIQQRKIEEFTIHWFERSEMAAEETKKVDGFTECRNCRTAKWKSDVQMQSNDQWLVFCWKWFEVIEEIINSTPKVN